MGKIQRVLTLAGATHASEFPEIMDPEALQAPRQGYATFPMKERQQKGFGSLAGTQPLVEAATGV